ncbi:hypothetical protein [Streptomyces cyanogenus]|uniref:WD domain, G-beta repeat n=1 Tax=Streptomyces cyanogenus TaxID=80860 RepID=A0ABX7U677_STRCY|nr:hypothetical protein [Streptomyces cyanogenus]QTE03111.1 WD domain, G-beta repeat [Streptomyces cyanogenus]
MAGRPESPLDPSAGPVQRLAFELRSLRAEAGSPTYRVMAQRAGQGASTLSQAAAGERLPTLPVVLAYVRACGGDPEEWRERWCQAATEAAAEPRTEGDEAEPPYRGLARFEPTDADLFFGRDELTERLFQQACSRRFTAVFGPSGSGKSSLLRAGLIPRLRTPGQSGPRPAALRVLTPGEHPMRTHAERLAPADGDGDTWLVVDQFEELYTLCTDPGEREEFLGHLLASTDPVSRLRVVIAVRADFLGRCAAHPQLTAALQNATVLSGPMSRDELREAIVKPAQWTGLIVERALSARILEEVEDEPGALPLMSHALLETWRRRRGRALTLEAYEAAGGLHGAIAHTAEGAYARLTPAQADLARRIMLRLITPGEGTPDTRRPVPRTELAFDSPTDTAVVLDRLARARLLTLDHDTVDLAHEALITAWPRLRQWIGDARERLRLHRQLTEAARTWDDLDRDKGALYRGTRLDAAEEAFIVAEHKRELTALERDFLTASVEMRRREQRAAVRTTRRLRSLVAGLTALVLVACAAVTVALQQRAAARAERDAAVSRQITAEADRLHGGGAVPLQNQNEALAAQLDVTAYHVRRSPQTFTNLVADAASPLFTDVGVPNPDGPNNAYLPNGGRASYVSAHHILALAGANVIRLWDTTDFTHPKLIGRALPGWQATLSPDGRTLAVAGYDLTVGLWSIADVAHPHHLGTLPAPDDDLGKFMAFNDDGTLLAVGGDHTSSLWDVHDSGHPEVLVPSLPGDLAAFSPRRPLLATLSTEDGTVRFWDTSHPRHPTVVSRLNSRMTDGDILSFSPNGRIIATGGAEKGQIGLVDVSRPHRPVVLNANSWEQLRAPDSTRTAAVAYSPDGRLLAIAGDDAVQLWELAPAGSPQRLGPPLSRRSQEQTALAFGPDSRSLIVEDHQTLRVWRLPPIALPDCSGMSSATFSADGNTMVTACSQGSVQLWDTNTTSPEWPKPLPRRLSGTAAEFAPRGHLLAVAPQQGGVGLYDATDPSRPRQVGHVPAGKGYGVEAMRFRDYGRTLVTYELQEPEATEGNSASQDTSQAMELGSGGVRIRTWDITDPTHCKPLGVGNLPYEDTTVEDFTLGADGRTLAVQVDDDGYQLWDTSNPTRPAKRGRPLPGDAVALAPNGRYLATVTLEGTIRMWETTHKGRPKLLGNWPQAQERAEGVAFSPDNRTLASATPEGAIQLWDVSDPARPSAQGHSFPSQGAFSNSFVFSPDGRTLVTTDGSGGAFWLWVLDPRRAIHRICDATGHILTRREWNRYVGDLPYDPPCV